MTSCIARETTGLCGVQYKHGLSQAGILPSVSSDHDTAQFSTDYFCFKISVQAVPFHVVLGYLMGKTSYNTRRGHKRSSGHERYPSPIQASLSCCASSKGPPERIRCANKFYVNIWEYFRKYTCFARGEDKILKHNGSTVLTVQSSIEALLRMIKALLPSPNYHLLQFMSPHRLSLPERTAL